MKSRDEQLLREAIRQALSEEFADYGVSPWFGPYGMGKGASKSTKSSSSYGVPGGSLYGIFIQPFLDAAKVVGSELGQTGVKLVGLLRTVIESALEALLPKFMANYDKIQADEKKLIDKIKEKYQDAYKAVDEAWEHEDIQFFAFMHDPTTFLSYKLITAKPQAAISVYEMMADGNAALLNYLRDIRNRMYGAQSPGAGVPMARPVAMESRQLREGDKVSKKVDFQGLEIHIDRPEGFIQTGTDKDGNDWEREYLFDYGFIKGTEGGDDEDLDVFVGPDDDAAEVFLVTQKTDDGEFDEYKAFIGFATEDEALAAYEAHIPMRYFESVCSIPLGALKGLLGLEPNVDLSEATIKPNVKKPAVKQKTPAEQVAAALTDPKFLKMVAGLPMVQQMKQDATAVNKQTGAKLQRAMSPVLNADTAEDLARASGGTWQVPQEYAQLKPEEKAETDEILVKQAKASMSTYFSSQLEGLVKNLLDSGVSENSPYVQSLRSQISALAKYKG